MPCYQEITCPACGSGIRDTARVLKINKNTVMSTLKKAGAHRQAQGLEIHA